MSRSNSPIRDRVSLNKRDSNNSLINNQIEGNRGRMKDSPSPSYNNSNSRDVPRRSRSRENGRQGGFDRQSRENSQEQSRDRQHHRSRSNDNNQRRRRPSAQRSTSRGRMDERKRRGGEERQGERQIFDYKVFINKDFLREGAINESYLNKICHQTKCSNVFFDEKIEIPDIPGKVLVFQSDIIDIKADALQVILRKLLEIQTEFSKNKIKTSLLNSTSILDFLILIPEGLVALVIGGKGRQIKNFMDESGADIVVNQPVYGMSQRSVSIRGQPKHIATACQKIYTTLEKYAYSVEDIEKKAEPIQKDKVKSCCKYVVKEESVGFIIGKNGSFTKYLQDELNVHMNCYRDKTNRALRSDESVVRMTGSLQDIQEAIMEFCKRLDEYYESVKKNFKNYPLAILIPSNLVTKIIGAGGCMIKEISQKSRGANIRIHSSKDSDRDLSEIVVTIEGSLQSKYDAACMIIEQIELFKNGGPILSSGQALNSNLAGQIRNSVPFQRSDAYKNEYEERSGGANINGGSNQQNAESEVRPRKKHQSRSRSKTPQREQPLKDQSQQLLQNDRHHHNQRRDREHQDDLDIEDNSFLDFNNNNSQNRNDFSSLKGSNISSKFQLPQQRQDQQRDMLQMAQEESSNTNLATESSQHRGPISSDGYEMMTDINEDGDLVVNFEINIPASHPILDAKFEDIEKTTNCVINVRNKISNKPSIQIQGSLVNISTGFKTLGNQIISLERKKGR